MMVNEKPMFLVSMRRHQCHFVKEYLLEFKALALIYIKIKHFQT